MTIWLRMTANAIEYYSILHLGRYSVLEVGTYVLKTGKSIVKVHV